MIRVLLLEDDTLFGESLHEYLSECEYEVKWLKNVEAAIEDTFDKEYDLYILDINLPDGDGRKLLKELRDSCDNTPALFLTSYNDKESLIEGFQSGCDDFLTKPVDLDELELRIQALLKRCNKVFESVTFGNGVVFDIKNCRLIKEGEDLKVTVKALSLLELFIKHSNEVITKQMIQDELWRDEEFSEGSLRVYVNRLKKVLPKDTIVNLKGIGYRFELK